MTGGRKVLSINLWGRTSAAGNIYLSAHFVGLDQKGAPPGTPVYQDRKEAMQ